MNPKLIEEAWYRGKLTFKLHASQRKINATFALIKGQLFVANCSRQLGKSYWAVCKAIETALQIPGAQIRYGAAFHGDLMEYIIPAFNKVMEDCPASIKAVYKSTGTAFEFPNGSRIKLVGLDKNPDGLRGNTLDLIILDECGFVANLDYIYKSVIIPATTHRPNAKIIMISTPPKTPAHPFMDYALRAQEEGSYSIFTIYDNPMITESTIQRLMKESGGETSTFWRREYLCEFVTDSDLQIIPEWEDKYVVDIEPDEYYKYYHRYVGMDLGTKDYTACIFGYYDFKRASLVIQDEFKMNGPEMNTLMLVGAIKSRELELWGEIQPFRRISDNNNLHLIQDMQSIHSLNFIPTNKESLEAMINEVRLMVQAGQILVNPRCKSLIGCLKYGVWDTNKKQFARSNTYGHFDHLAALIYLVRNLAKHSNPIPADHGHDFTKSWVGHISTQHSKNANTIHKALIPNTIRKR